jgi:glycosyltransferase involved in cell wall biosynthesis
MACGTPVIAWRCGSVPEVVEEGVSGFIVEDEDEAMTAIAKLGTIDRRAVRAAFERRFTAEVMARNYLRLYWRLRRGIEPATTVAPAADGLELAS